MDCTCTASRWSLDSFVKGRDEGVREGGQVRVDSRLGGLPDRKSRKDRRDTYLEFGSPSDMKKTLYRAAQPETENGRRCL
jgi:hypothetical protein